MGAIFGAMADMDLVVRCIDGGLWLTLLGVGIAVSRNA